MGNTSLDIRLTQHEHHHKETLQAWADQEITGENTNDELAVLCSQGEREWKPNVIIDCPVLNGGFGNVRLNLLQCIRYAIEARVSLKLPTISRRSASDITDFVTNDQMGLDYLIDDHRMVNRLQKACPELVVHPSDYEDKRLRRLPEISPVLDLHIDSHLPEGLPGDFAVPTAPGQWPPALDKWIESHTERQPPSAESPVIFGLRAIMFAWPVAYDPPSARVEKDANDYHWLSYEDQIRYLTQRLQGRKGNDTHPRDPDLPDTDRAVIYVASGDKPGIAKLAEDVAPITVVTKNDLLPEDTLDGQMLRNMTWDQQALVDMLILEHSGYFIGVRDSTFSWHLALRRAAAVNWVVGDYPKDCWLDDKKTRRSGCKAMLADNEEWRDDLSALVGNGHVRLEPQVVKTIWP
ncbi:hypothetical protein Cob_v002108 [Colletotrichum orbiculare MAFF 240422]|uniref:Alternative oxidase n=1 Tax=Colletotrichum orbiculare (strain 104-T / ATCC 96160 / CBS 514.97 / LARS 414 / MAFF 240422) TaxID=1213857 RepID=A0A484G5D8_COLOR|nr:hypothetical protein Cob_v002108 [Colletotrichum orbiculare MAFF 240422]